MTAAHADEHDAGAVDLERLKFLREVSVSLLKRATQPRKSERVWDGLALEHSDLVTFIAAADALLRGEARAATDEEKRSRTTINWLVALVKDAYVDGWRHGQSDMDRDDGWRACRANMESQRLMIEHAAESASAPAATPSLLCRCADEVRCDLRQRAERAEQRVAALEKAIRRIFEGDDPRLRIELDRSDIAALRDALADGK